MSDGPALFAAIRAHPDEDAPRLVYADWLQEQGEDLRAEFIRVQCELARGGRPSRTDFRRAAFGELRRQTESLYSAAKVRRLRGVPWERLWVRAAAIGDARYDEHEARTAALRVREFDLIDQHGAEWFDTTDGFRIMPCRDPEPRLVEYGCGAIYPAHVRRGFVDSITSPGGDWLRHGDEVLTSHPLRYVRLTSRPQLAVTREWFTEVTIDGSVARCHCTATIAGRFVHAVASEGEPVEELLLAARWPGVTFTLPKYGRLIYITWEAILGAPFPI